MKGMKVKEKALTLSAVFSLFVLAAILMLKQLTGNSFYSVVENDTYAYVTWARQFSEALAEGEFYPRWLSDNFGQYGSPTFVLYSPLAFYLSSFFNLFTGSITVAMNLVKFAALFLSSAGVFFLAKEFYPKRVAFCAAAFYLLLPYTVSGVYLSGAYASTVATAWFSPCLLFLKRFIDRGNWKDMLYGGFCYGGLIMTHLISAYIFSFVILAFAVFMPFAVKSPVRLFVAPAVMLTGISVAAAYVLPLVFEMKFVNTAVFVSDGYSFRNFFVFPLSVDLPMDHFWVASYGETCAHILLFLVILLLAMRVASRRKSLERVPNGHIALWFFTGVSLCSIFLLFGVSTFIWENIPYFRYIQFPIRWAGITAFASAFLFAAVGASLAAGNVSRYLLALLLLVFVAADYGYVSSAHSFSEDRLMSLRGDDWNQGYLPISANSKKIEAKRDAGRAILIQGKGRTDIRQWKSHMRIIEVNADEPVSLRIRTFYFPGWKAFIDGQETKIALQKETGAMLVPVAEGKHEVVLKFEDTPARFYGKIISLVSLFIIGAASVLMRNRRRESERQC